MIRYVPEGYGHLTQAQLRALRRLHRRAFWDGVRSIFGRPLPPPETYRRQVLGVLQGEREGQ